MKEKISSEAKFEKIQQSKWAQIMEVLFNVIVLNVNIILFSLLGLGVLGIGPAIYASYAVLTKYDGLNLPTNIFKEFWKEYKQNFVHGNIIFYCTTIIITILIHNLHYYSNSTTAFGLIGLYIICAILLLVITTMISYYTVDVIYREKKIKDRIRIAFYMVFLNPLTYVKIMGKSIGFAIVMLLFPQFIIFFGFSTPIVLSNKPVREYITRIVDVKTDEK